jgi:uncharacterized protein
MGQAHGDIWWSELMASDVQKAAKFYQKVIGWEPFTASIHDMSQPAKAGEPSYTLFMKDGEPVCGAIGMGQVGITGAPPHWFTYIAVDDVDSACADVTAAGGKVMRPSFDVPGVGRIAIVEDANGAMVGLGTPVRQTAPQKKLAAKQAKAAARQKKSPAKKRPAPKKKTGARRSRR